jgi:hypothetical protein
MSRRGWSHATAVLLPAGVLVAGAAWLVYASASSLVVTPKNATAFQTCVLTGYPTTSTVVADSWVDEGNNAKKGGATTLQVTSHSSKNARAYVRFDLTKCSPAIAATATVRQATLRLSLSVVPGSARTYSVYRVTAPCPEAASTCWTEANVTWGNQPTGVSAATSSVSLTSSSALQYYGWHVTADAAAMVAGPASNYGWRIADSVEGNASAVTAEFKAKDAANDPAGAPQLVVVYSP